MLELKLTAGFKKDLKKIKNKKDIEKIFDIITKLQNGKKLEEKYKDHQLKGNLKQYRECHIKPDLLLLYEIRKNELVLIAYRVGSHTELLKIG